jgi:uncharacterized membrane protein
MKKTIFYMIIAALFIYGCTTNLTGNAVKEDTCSIGKKCDEYFHIPLSEITTEMQKYHYETGNTVVKFFAILGSDGKIRTAFDACDVCGGYKGYSQKGNDVICNKCGRFFSIDDIGTKNGPGGCWPSYLSYEIQGDEVLIKKSELEKGAFRFA